MEYEQFTVYEVWVESGETYGHKLVAAFAERPCAVGVARALFDAADILGVRLVKGQRMREKPEPVAS